MPIMANTLYRDMLNFSVINCQYRAISAVLTALIIVVLKYALSTGSEQLMMPRTVPI